jgi:Domain of unknown function (DUF4260)
MKIIDSPDCAVGPSVVGSVRLWLRAEGLAVFALGVLAYARTDAGFGMFAALFLVPDLSLAGYLFGARKGAAVYNAVHSYMGPLVLAALAVAGALPAALPLAFIWTAHIGLDRALGFGLKYPSAFGDTHLGRIGKKRQPSRLMATA